MHARKCPYMAVLEVTKSCESVVEGMEKEGGVQTSDSKCQ